LVDAVSSRHLVRHAAATQLLLCSDMLYVLCLNTLPVQVNLISACRNYSVAGAEMQGHGERAGWDEAASYVCRKNSCQVANRLLDIVSSGMSCCCTAGCWDSATQHQVMNVCMLLANHSPCVLCGS